MPDIFDCEHAYNLIKKFHDERQAQDGEQLMRGEMPDMVDALITRAQMDALAWTMNDAGYFGEGENKEFAEGAAQFEEVLRRLERRYQKPSVDINENPSITELEDFWKDIEK